MPRKSHKRANGEGSVYWSDGYGRYVGQATLGRTESGKLIQKRLYGPLGDRSRTARLGVEERMKKYLGKRGARNGTATLREFTEQWIARAPIRAKTREGYEWLVSKHFGRLGAKHLIDLEPIDIREHLDALNVGQPSKQKVYNLIHRVLNEAAALDLIGRNPASSVKAPRVTPRRPRALSPTEVHFLLQAASGDRLEAAIVLALTATLGPAELFGLRRSDIHLAEGHLIVNSDLVWIQGRKPAIEDTKTPKRRRRIDLPVIAVEALRRRLKLCLAEGGSELVFTAQQGGPVDLHLLRRRWWKPLLHKAALAAERAAKEAGDEGYRFPVGLRFYDLRHTSNALMGLAGVPIEAARERLGHASIRTTADVYGAYYPSMQRDVAGQLDRLFEGIRKVGSGSG